jgi:hypothetical protein
MCIITQIGSSPLFFSFYLSPFLMVISTGFKILYSLLYRNYINHIYLNFLLLLLTSPKQDLFFIILLVFALGLFSTYERENMRPLAF